MTELQYCSLSTSITKNTFKLKIPSHVPATPDGNHEIIQIKPCRTEAVKVHDSIVRSYITAHLVPLGQQFRKCFGRSERLDLKTFEITEDTATIVISSTNIEVVHSIKSLKSTELELHIHTAPDEERLTGCLGGAAEE